MKPFLASFEDYLPLLIFFALWWITAKKRKGLRQQPPQPTAPSAEHSGERFNLQEILKQILTGKVEMPLPPDHGPQPSPAAETSPGGTADRLSLVDKWESSQVSDKDPIANVIPPRPALTPTPLSYRQSRHIYQSPDHLILIEPPTAAIFAGPWSGPRS